MHQNNKINVPDHISVEMKQVLLFQQENAPPIAIDADYKQQREYYNRERHYWNENGPDMYWVQNKAVMTDMGEINTRIYYPQDRHEAVLFYLHGGGFILGGLDTHDRIMRLLAKYSGCAVVGIDYSLAPEARYPHAIEEIAAVSRYYHQHADEHQLTMRRIAFAGDSSGAMLALATVLWLRDRQMAFGQVNALLLYYGLYGLQDSVSRQLYGGAWDGLTQADLEAYQQAYLAHDSDRQAPYYCLFNSDLTHDIPPCYIAGAEFDPLLDDSVALYRTLRAHRQPCHYQEYPGMLHAFLHYSRMMGTADRALRDGADYLRQRLAGA